MKRVVYFDKYGNIMNAKPTGRWVVRYASNTNDFYISVEFVRKRRFLFWKLSDKTFWLAEELFNYFIQDEINE